MDTETAIELKNISKSFAIPTERRNTLKKYFLNPFHQSPIREFTALRDLSFTVSRGEFLGIIGRNGSGKSTLLKIIADIYAPDHGKVSVSGRIIPFLELGVGFNPELTGRENVFLNGIILGMTREYITKKYNEIVQFAELERFMDTPVKNYSSGMLVRLGFSVAIQADADIYILDEILAVGDEAFQRKSISVINKFKQEGKTVLFVSHDMGAIQKYCNRAILINDSKLVMAGQPDEVIRTYREITNRQSKAAEPQGTSSPKQSPTDVAIEKAEIFDDSGTPTSLFLKESKVKLKVHYQSFPANKHKAVYLGVSIFREDGLHITGSNGKLFHQKVSLEDKAKGVINYEIDSSLFLDGKYSFTVGLFDYETDETLDFHSRMYPFEIRTYRKEVGVVSLPTHWSVDKD